MLKSFLKRAYEDEPVYITDVRHAFQTSGTRPFHIHTLLYSGTIRVFPLMLPETDTAEEETFVASYVHATIYNILSSLGALRIDLYFKTNDRKATKLATHLSSVFQVDLSKAQRTSYGKCLNVNERTIFTLTHGKENFFFGIHSISDEPSVSEKPSITYNGSVFQQLPELTSHRMVLGMDIGGTDIKLAVSIDGKLRICKEFDWFPASFATAEQLINPILFLTQLLRAAGTLIATEKMEKLDRTALSKTATYAEIKHGIAVMEKAAGSLRNFDAIGLCFPDVVIRNRIVGGETYKTRGMRENTQLNYEKQFAKISGLCDLLKEYTTADGVVMNTNDGPMAAFTAAVEQAAAGKNISNGFFAHTLGTELGTGWVRPDGSIPEIPLEVYNFIIDLGSFPQKQYDANDIRSINNFNTLLPGTLQKYTCQSGVFRLAVRNLPMQDPATYQEAFERGLFIKQGDIIAVPTAPTDMRKECLEFFMRKASSFSQSPCADIFRTIGEYLAVTWAETEYILQPEAKERTLFGRLVKNPVCFYLICEGAAKRAPDLVQYAADGNMANTDLMKQLANSSDYSVAQFAQAVGAIYYGCLGLLA